MIRRAVTIIGIAVVGLLIFGVAACGSSPYSPEVRENFLAACQAEGASRSYCACSLELVENRFSEKEFLVEEVKFAMGQASNELTDVLAESIVTCLPR